MKLQRSVAASRELPGNDDQLKKLDQVMQLTSRSPMK
jgi:hypothetical protein